MIMLIRAVKANSNSLLSAEENFGIKQDSVPPCVRGWLRLLLLVLPELFVLSFYGEFKYAILHTCT